MTLKEMIIRLVLTLICIFLLCCLSRIALGSELLCSTCHYRQVKKSIGNRIIIDRDAKKMLFQYSDGRKSVLDYSKSPYRVNGELDVNTMFEISVDVLIYSANNR